MSIIDLFTAPITLGADVLFSYMWWSKRGWKTRSNNSYRPTKSIQWSSFINTSKINWNFNFENLNRNMVNANNARTKLSWLKVKKNKNKFDLFT